MTYGIFFNDHYIGMFVCDKESEATKEMHRLQKLFPKFNVDLVRQ
jgi:hypothetical protein